LKKNFLKFIERFKLSFISMIFYVYIIIIFLFSNLFNISDSFKSLLAQPCLILFPYLIGKPFIYLINNILSIRTKYDIIIDIMLNWGFGVIVIIIIEIFLYCNYLFSIDYFLILLLIISLFSIFIKENVKYDSLHEKEVYIAFFYGLLFSFFITLYWNYPFTSANDYISHSYSVLKIVRDSHPLIFGFSYVPTMQTLYAILLKLFKINSEPLYLLWSSRFLFYPLYVCGLFYLINNFINKKWLSLNISIIGSSLIYSYGGSLFALDTAPKNIISILSVYIFYILLNNYKDKVINNFSSFIIKIFLLQISFFILLYSTDTNGIIGYQIGMLLLFMLFLIPLITKSINNENRSLFLLLSILLICLEFFHKIMGLIAGVITISYLIFLYYFKKFNVTTCRYFNIIVIIMTGITINLFNFNIITYPKEPILLKSSSLFLFGWDNLKMFIKLLYPNVLFDLLISSLLIIVFISNNKEMLATSLISSLIIFAYFMPVITSYRFMMFIHPLVLSLLSYSLCKLFSKIHKKSYLIILIIVFNSIIGINIYIKDMNEFKESRLNRIQETHQLFQIGDFIKDNIEKDTLLVGHIEWLYSLYASYGQIDFIYLWDKGIFKNNIIEDILLSETSDKAYDKLKLLYNNKKYFVTAPDKNGNDINRFYKKPSDIIFVYSDLHAQWLGHPNSLTKFLDPRYFEILFITTNMNGQNFYIIKLNKEIKKEYQNLLENPSFESLPPMIGWEKYTYTEENIKDIERNINISVDSNALYGNYSLKISMNTTNKKTWFIVKSTPINVVKGKYFISSNMKYTNVRESHIKLIYNTTEGILKNHYVTYGKNGMSDWKSYSTVVEIPEGVNTVMVLLLAGGIDDPNKGESITWFDEIDVIGPIYHPAYEK